MQQDITQPIKADEQTKIIVFYSNQQIPNTPKEMIKTTQMSQPRQHKQNIRYIAKTRMVLIRYHRVGWEET